MSEKVVAYFIGGPLDQQHHEVIADISTVTIPSMSFTWTDIGGLQAQRATIQRWHHRYERTEWAQAGVNEVVFVYEGEREVGR